MRATGQVGTLAMASFGLLVLAIVGLLALDSWWTFGVAIALMVVGVIAMARFVQRIGWTRRSGTRLQDDGLQGMNEDLAISDEVHSELTAHDLPLDHPAHHGLAHVAERRQRTPAG